MEPSKVVFVLLVIHTVAKTAPTDDSCVLSNECNWTQNFSMNGFARQTVTK